MLDISDEKYPKVVGMFPKAPKALLERGGGYILGPAIHNIHENTPGPDSFRSDDRIYAVSAVGGLRIYDVADPYRIQEIGYYVPGTPKRFNPNGPQAGGVSREDLWVDNKRLVYLSGYNGGLEIVESTG